MKKILILILLIFITGCETKYTLKYTDGVFKENINIKNFVDDGDGEGEPGVDYYESYPIYFDIDKTHQFEVNVKKGFDKKYDLNFESIYNDISFSKSSVFNECMQFHEYEEDENFIYISLYGDYYCYAYDKLEIEFISDNKVTYSNAHKINNEKYSWVYEFGDNIDISIEIDKKQNNGFNFFIIYYIVGGIFILALMLLVFKFYKSYKINKVV